MRAKRQSWCLYLALFLTLFTGFQSPCLAQFSFLSASRNLEIYYATSRFNESPNGRPLYSGARHLDLGLGQGSTEYGTVSFVTPPGNNASIASCPSWDNLRNEMENRDNYWKSASLGQINRLGESDFYNRVRNFHGLICIYVHGYDMTFDEASREMAELADEYQRRSNQPIMPILYTWPSSGNKADYNGDEASLEWSEKPFREFINRLASARSYDSSIDLVAHSMGSRLAFWYGMVEGPRLSLPPFRNVFLSCADTDYHTAEQRKDDLQKCLSGCLYVLTNDDDGPLATSALMHVQPRLGRPVDSGMATNNRDAQPLNKQNLSAKASSLLSANSQTILNSVENILISKAKAGNSNNKNSLTQMAMETWV